MLLFTIDFTDGYSHLSAFGGFMKLLVDFLKTKFLTFSPNPTYSTKKALFIEKGLFYFSYQ